MPRNHQFTTNALNAHLLHKISVEEAENIHLKTHRRHERMRPVDGKTGGAERPAFLMPLLRQKTIPETTYLLSY